jgi:diketogulonate reductase-like aldo/keto reductase
VEPAYDVYVYYCGMIKRKIPSTGELLPAIGIGTWSQFDVGSSDAERKPLTEVLKMMTEKGATLIDSSPMYGRSEGVVGDLAQKLNPTDYFYATKVWTKGEQEGIAQMQSSFQKMKTEKMDLMQVHNLVDYKIHLQTLKKWKAEGKVKYIGITHYTVGSHPELESIIKKERLDFVQFNYSIRIRNAEKSLFHTAMDMGVATIINEPLEKGDLFNLVKGKALPAWVTEYDIHNWAQFFIKYIVSHPAVTCVIPGTSVPQHMLDILGAGYGIIPDEAGRKRMVEYIESL